MGIFRNSLCLMNLNFTVIGGNTNFHLNDTCKHVSIPGYKTREQSCFPVHWKTPSSIALWCYNSRPCKNLLQNGGFFANLGFLSYTDRVLSWQMEEVTVEQSLPCQSCSEKTAAADRSRPGDSTHKLVLTAITDCFRKQPWETQNHKPFSWIPRLKCFLSLWLLNAKKTNFSSHDIWLWAAESTSQS